MSQRSRTHGDLCLRGFEEWGGGKGDRQNVVQFSLTLGCSCLQDFYSSVLDILTPDDVRILVETEDEYSRRGQFERVFPTHISMRYLRFFEQPRYFNILVTQWELKYYLNKHKGNCHPRAWHSHLSQAGCLPVIMGDF